MLKFLLLTLIPFGFFPQIKAQKYELADWYNNKSAAISLTFDDGILDQFKLAVPELDKRNIKATFYVIPNLMSVSWEMLDSFASEGHEIGSHTTNHLNLVKCDSITIDYELSSSKKIINSKIKSQKCYSFAYPFGAYNDKISQMASKYYITVRTVKFGMISSNNLNFEKLPIFAYQPKYKLADINLWTDICLQKKKWQIECFHGFNGIGAGPIPLEDFISHLDYIKSKENEIWIDNVINVSKYLTERNNAKFTVLGNSNGKLTFDIEDGLSDSIYNHKLTVLLKLPVSYKINRISQDKLLDFRINNFDCDSQLIQFNALPNNKTITLEYEEQTPSTNFNIRINRCSNQLLCYFASNSLVSLNIWTTSGKLVFSQNNTQISAGIKTFYLNTDLSSNGYFIADIFVNTEGGNTYCNKSFKIFSFCE